jgi:hypothetical protein
MTIAVAICSTCRTPFTFRRSTARYCGDACRKAAQRNRARGLPVEPPLSLRRAAANAFLSVTGQLHTSDRPKPLRASGVTLKRDSQALPKDIVPDAKYPRMYRLRHSDGSLSEMVNLTRAKDALAEVGDGSAA